MSGTTDRLNLDAAREQHDLAAHTDRSSEVRWLPLLGGGFLAGYGLSRSSAAGLLTALAGGGMAYYGYTGRMPVSSAIVPDGETSVRVEKAVTINRSPASIYAEWHDIEQLPRIMSHLISVKQTADGLSHWVARAPAGRTVEWDAEVIHDQTNRVIAWRSVGDTAVPNVGSVRFNDAPGGRGTEVKVTLEYSPPGGALGATIAKLLGEEPGQQVADDLRRFKQFIETGEYPTTLGQPRGGSQHSLMDATLETSRRVIEAADSVTGSA
jgi:uncharacterized membrane protein